MADTQDFDVVRRSSKFPSANCQSLTAAAQCGYTGQNTMEIIMPESQNVEWKESWRDEYLKWVCAFANTQGGVLDIGRNDDGVVVGLDDVESFLVTLPNKIRDMLGVMADVDLLNEDGEPFIRITVEAYPYPVSLRGKYYTRSGSTTQTLTGAALDRFLLSKTGLRWDAVPVPNVAVADLDTDTLKDFRERAAKSKRLDQKALEERDAGLVGKLRLMDGEHLKRAAVLLFHPDPERWIAGAWIKIGYFETNADLRYQDEIHGNLFQQVDKAMDLLLTKYMKAEIGYEGVQREERYPVPEEALREILLNAIAHKDYASNVPIQISVYEDRIQFWNNGQLPEAWTVEQLQAKHSSQPHNPDIANTLFRAGLIEAWGRGIERVIQACETYGIKPPELKLDATGLWVTFGLDGPSRDQVGTKLVLRRDQEKILRNSIESSSLLELMELSGRSNRTKFRDQVLRPLLDAGLMEMTLPDKPKSSKQRYRITKAGQAALADSTRDSAPR